jgi:hypothetical protein
MCLIEVIKWQFGGCWKGSLVLSWNWARVSGGNRIQHPQCSTELCASWECTGLLNGGGFAAIHRRVPRVHCNRNPAQAGFKTQDKENGEKEALVAQWLNDATKESGSFCFSTLRCQAVGYFPHSGRMVAVAPGTMSKGPFPRKSFRRKPAADFATCHWPELHFLCLCPGQPLMKVMKLCDWLSLLKGWNWEGVSPMT